MPPPLLKRYTLQDMRFLLFLLGAASLLEGALFEGHKVSLQPETYWTKREREGGSSQTGWLFGIRGRYDRIVPWGIYLGGHLEWAKGSLSGKNGNGAKIRSNLTDSEAEVRGGFTLHTHKKYCFLLTPFVGWGAYEAKNSFKHPSPMLVTFRDSYEYAALGALFSITPNDRWIFGANFTARYVLDVRSKLTDPDEGINEKLACEEDWQYEVEIPVKYRLCCAPFSEINIGAVPFWRLRKFGGMENYPHKFFETTYTNWGLRLDGTITF